MDIRVVIGLLSIIGFVCVTLPLVYGDSIDNWKILIKSTGSSNSTYWPSELQAKPLESIEWENDDSIVHTITSGVPQHSDYAGKIFDSGLLKPGEKFTFKLLDNSWSAYYYYCKIHPWMKGKIDAITPYLGASPILTVSTNKSTYYDDDMLSISGKINKTYEKTPMTIQIFDQHKNLVFLKVLDIAKNDSYSYETNKLSTILTKSGNYKIKTLFGFPSVVTDANFIFINERNNDQNGTITQIAIPKWVKNNAKWWTQGSLSDSDFVGGIQFMVKNKIIKIQESKNLSENKFTVIPSWVKNNIQLWADGKTSDNEFAVAVTNLIQQGS